SAKAADAARTPGPPDWRTTPTNQNWRRARPTRRALTCAAGSTPPRRARRARTRALRECGNSAVTNRGNAQLAAYRAPLGRAPRSPPEVEPSTPSEARAVETGRSDAMARPTPASRDAARVHRGLYR